MKEDQTGKSQSDKFKQTAHDLGVELDEDRLKETLRKIAKPECEEDRDES